MMMRKALAMAWGLALLASGTGVYAQSAQPGYAVVRSGGGAAHSGGAPSEAVPEPVPLAQVSANGQATPASTGGMVPPGPLPWSSSGAGVYPVSPLATLTSAVMDPPSSFGTETVWISASYLMGWLTRPKLATPLVTQGDTADARPGALGQPGTRILYGDEQFRFGNLHGLTAEIGVNLNDSIYLEGRGFVFWPQHTRYTVASDANGAPFIARPVFDTLTSSEGSYRTSTPNQIVGYTTIDARQQIFGYETHLRYNLKLTPYLDVDWLLGYRRLQLEEDLRIFDFLQPTAGSITFLGTTIAAPNTVSDFDRFKTINQFNGVNLGGRFRWQSGYDWLAFQGYYKVALGVTNQTLKIDGLSVADTTVGRFAEVGGILAQPTNIGVHKRSEFGVIPELGVGLVFLPTRYVRLHAGYSALYWNNVIRPTSSIDRRVNPAFVPTDTNYGIANPGNFPSVVFKSESLWLQTINFGLELYY
ncbi:MAG: BBP7 family outer membrane beta-barrel protein [Gemmataceae bacterium]|nr:BBP7 family outer membrane beta-barrel protein [Gemmataceae bacterium]